MNSTADSTSKDTVPPGAIIRKQGIFHQLAYFRADKWVAIFGDWIYWFMVSWYVLNKTNSGVQMGILLMIWALLPVLIIPWGDDLYLKGSRKTVPVIICLIRAAVVFILSGLLASQSLQIWIIYTATAIMAGCGALSHSTVFNISRITKTDQTVPGNPDKEQNLFETCAMIGIFMGGILYDWTGIVSGLRICAVIYMIGAGLKVIINSPVSNCCQTGQPRVKMDQIYREFKSGLDYYLNNRWLLRILLFFSLSSVLIWPFITIYLPYVFKTLKSGSLAPALVQGSYWAGMIIGYTVISQLSIKDRIRSSISNSYLFIILILLLATIPLAHIFKPDLTTWSISVIYLMLTIFFGVTMASLNIQINTLVQIKLPDSIRIFALNVWRTVVSASIPIGFLMGGYLTAVIPMYWLLMLVALGILLISISLGRVLELREIQHLTEDA